MVFIVIITKGQKPVYWVVEHNQPKSVNALITSC